VIGLTHQHKMRDEMIHGKVEISLGEEKVGIQFDWNKEYIFTFIFDFSGVESGLQTTVSNRPITFVESEITLQANERQFSNKFQITGQSEKLKIQNAMRQSFDSELSQNVMFQIMTAPEVKTFDLDNGNHITIKFANLVIKLKDGNKEFKLIHVSWSSRLRIFILTKIFLRKLW